MGAGRPGRPTRKALYDPARITVPTQRNRMDLIEAVQSFFEEDGARRMRAMRRYLFKHDLDHWASSFFDALHAQASGAGSSG